MVLDSKCYMICLCIVKCALNDHLVLHNYLLLPCNEKLLYVIDLYSDLLKVLQ